MSEVLELGQKAADEQDAEPQAQEQLDAPPDSSFALAVSQALAHRKISSICRECASAAGWGDWSLLAQPAAMPVFGAEAVTLAAQLTCKRCGYMRFYSLPFLGVNIEQRRIITPP